MVAEIGEINITNLQFEAKRLKWFNLAYDGAISQGATPEEALKYAKYIVGDRKK